MRTFIVLGFKTSECAINSRVTVQQPMPEYKPISFALRVPHSETNMNYT